MFWFVGWSFASCVHHLLEGVTQSSHAHYPFMRAAAELFYGVVLVVPLRFTWRVALLFDDQKYSLTNELQEQADQAQQANKTLCSALLDRAKKCSADLEADCLPRFSEAKADVERLLAQWLTPWADGLSVARHIDEWPERRAAKPVRAAQEKAKKVLLEELREVVLVWFGVLKNGLVVGHKDSLQSTVGQITKARSIQEVITTSQAWLQRAQFGLELAAVEAGREKLEAALRRTAEGQSASEQASALLDGPRTVRMRCCGIKCGKGQYKDVPQLRLCGWHFATWAPLQFMLSMIIAIHGYWEVSSLYQCAKDQGFNVAEAGNAGVFVVMMCQEMLPYMGPNATCESQCYQTSPHRFGLRWHVSSWFSFVVGILLLLCNFMLLILFERLGKPMDQVARMYHEKTRLKQFQADLKMCKDYSPSTYRLMKWQSRTLPLLWVLRWVTDRWMAGPGVILDNLGDGVQLTTEETERFSQAARHFCAASKEVASHSDLADLALQDLFVFTSDTTAQFDLFSPEGCAALAAKRGRPLVEVLRSGDGQEEVSWYPQQAMQSGFQRPTSIVVGTPGSALLLD